MRPQRTISQPSQKRTRRLLRSGGFTLVELMVVIIIILALAALLLPALQRAKARAEEARILVEINQLQQACEQFKSTYGAYPPVGRGNPTETAAVRQARVRAFIQRAFPRYAAPAGTYNGVVNTLANLTPAESLVFWLGGMPTGGVTANPGRGVEGFSKDPSNSFGTTTIGRITGWQVATATQRTDPFFSFDTRRMIHNKGGTGQNDAFWEYMPEGRTTPYVYFRSDNYWDATNSLQGSVVMNTGGTIGGIAVPYRMSTNVATDAQSWASPGTFQILCAGVDNSFGTDATTARLFPTGTGYSAADDDNLTNFATQGSLGSQRP